MIYGVCIIIIAFLITMNGKSEKETYSERSTIVVLQFKILTGAISFN